MRICILDSESARPCNEAVERYYMRQVPICWQLSIFLIRSFFVWPPHGHSGRAPARRFLVRIEGVSGQSSVHPCRISRHAIAR